MKRVEAAAFPQEAAALDAAAEQTTTPSADGRIAWRIWGEGAPLVLLHGGHGSWLHWIRNIPFLSRRFRLLVPDLPGMGESDAAGDGRTMEPIGQALADGIDRILGREDYALGGFSFGSIAAGSILPHHRERVRHLILIGSGGLGRFDPVTGLLRRWQEEPDPARRLTIHRHNLSVLMLRDPARIDDLATRIQAYNAEHTVVNHREAAMSFDLRTCLRTHPVPITGIWGEKDRLVAEFLDERREFFRGLGRPGSFHAVSGAGHWVQYERPEAVDAIVSAVLPPAASHG